MRTPISSESRGAPSRRSRRSVALGSALLLATALALMVGPAQAVHDEGFELGGEIDGQPVDWVDLFDVDGSPGSTVTTPKTVLPDDFVAAAFAKDFVLPDTTGYATGSKDTLPISVAGQGDWQCKTPNNLGSKFDLVNAYAGALVPTSGDDIGDLIIYFGSEVSAPEGNRNMGVWLLQDPTVECSGTGNTDFSGSHVYGDVFVVAAFTNGGTVANIDVYEWVDTTPATPEDDPDVNGQLEFKEGFTSATCPPSDTADDACAIANTDGDRDTEAAFDIDPPWDAPDKDGGNLNEAQFMEGAVNLSDLGLDGCFATFLANSRSSQETGSTLHDFARDDFNTCGSLKVRKFVDLDGDGREETGDPLGDWSFEVRGPAPATTLLPCSGSTGSDGELVCASIAPGTYTITETQVSGYYNTNDGRVYGVGDPVVVNTGSTVSRSVTIGLGGTTTVTFGNICYVDKTFRIDGVPETATGKPSSITVQYSVNDGAYSDLSLVESVTEAGVWSASIDDTFLQTDTIDWRWYINSATSETVVGGTDESLQGSDPTDPNGTDRDLGCQKLNSDSYPTVTLTGLKFKDMDADGVRDTDIDPDTTGDQPEPGLGGFEFKLMQGTTQVGSTATSAADGTYSFTGVPAGSYTVEEVHTAGSGWLQTLPANNGSRSVTVALDDTGTITIGPFGNTPLSDIDVTFTALTDPAATESTISCTGPTQPTGSGGSLDGEQTDGSFSGDSLIIGTYECTIEIVDP